MNIKKLKDKWLERIRINWRSNWLLVLLAVVILINLYSYKVGKCTPFHKDYLGWIIYIMAFIVVVYRIRYEIKKSK